MRYTRLGKNGPRVSMIGFGAWAIGGTNWGKTDDAVSKKALHEALDQGVTLIDTADVYGFGHSEELIAEVLSERGKGDVIIATKAGNDFYFAKDSDSNGYGPIRQTYDKKYLVYAAEQSLKRLKLEALDILQLHSGNLENIDRDEPWEALEKLKKDGKIRYAGWSVQSFQESKQAFLLDRYKGVIDTIQVRYNLLEREAEKVLFPKAMENGIGVIVRIPMLFGLLTGKFNRDTRFSEEDHRHMNLSPEKLDRYLGDFEKIQPLYDRYGDQSKAQVSLRFCISHPACHVAIPGAKTPHQVKDNCTASDFGPIPREFIPELENK